MMTDQETVQRSAALGKISPTYGYYRQPNGWVKPAVVTELEELGYRREGWMPLPQYGRFDMGTGYAADHPLELLFINGGAKELCEEQIRQQGLYMNPPLLPSCRQALTQIHRRHIPACWVGAQKTVFPQVATMTGLGPFPCRFCGVAKPTVQARNQHEGVVHKEEKSDIRTGETLADGLIRGLRPGVPAPSADVNAALLKRIEELEAQMAAKVAQKGPTSPKVVASLARARAARAAKKASPVTLSAPQ